MQVIGYIAIEQGLVATRQATPATSVVDTPTTSPHLCGHRIEDAAAVRRSVAGHLIYVQRPQTMWAVVSRGATVTLHRLAAMSAFERFIPMDWVAAHLGGAGSIKARPEKTLRRPRRRVRVEDHTPLGGQRHQCIAQ